MTARPAIQLKPGTHRRAMSGHPWVYSNEIGMTAEAKALAPGTIVRLLAHDGRPLGTAMFNPRTLIAARLLAAAPDAVIDRDFFVHRLERAKALRDRLYGAPHYRLIHAEADGLPGAVIDRYGDVVAMQLNSAGMDALNEALVAALEAVLSPAAILLRNDSGARSLEGLPLETRWLKGEADGPTEIAENGARFLADLGQGQKTGWFFDQRENRASVAALAEGHRMLDLCCYAGGFAIQAALAGAVQTTGIDRSEPALALAARAADLNGVGKRCRFARGEVFAELERLRDGGERFGVVVADPPAFVKSKKDVGAGSRAYRKLARLSASVTAPGGFLFIASCSHNMEANAFAEEVRRGLQDAGRTGRILRRSGAAADHPVHPALPESAYLKAELLQLD
ncbi:MAG: class I SAM-dependent rRNA methyltransferase [Dongiaceae bacterium]